MVFQRERAEIWEVVNWLQRGGGREGRMVGMVGGISIGGRNGRDVRG